jgi:hypothetical protein
LGAFIINESKTMESKGCKRFATTTEAEIEEKRLKLNVCPRCINQSPFRKNATQKTIYIIII